MYSYKYRAWFSYFVDIFLAISAHQYYNNENNSKYFSFKFIMFNVNRYRKSSYVRVKFAFSMVKQYALVLNMWMHDIYLTKDLIFLTVCTWF